MHRTGLRWGEGACRAEGYVDRLEKALRRVLRPQKLGRRPNRTLALGGVRMSARNSFVRIDCVQHAARAMLKTMRHVY